MENWAAPDVLGRELGDALLIRNAEGLQAGADDRAQPSKRRSGTAVLTSRALKPFICPCPCAISHTRPASAQACLLYKPGVAVRQHGVGGGGREGGVGGFKRKKTNVGFFFHLSPKAHCSPFRRMTVLCTLQSSCSGRVW